MDELELQARGLERSGRFRVLRRLKPCVPVERARDRQLQLGVFVDVETTGLNPDIDEVIEVGMVPFSFMPTGEVIAVHECFSRLRQPKRPIPIEVTTLTGIDDAMVHGRSLTSDDLPSWLGDTALVVAHNAAFDRDFLERLFPIFLDLRWACSQRDVPWKEEGLKATGLEALAAAFGFFYSAHRGLDDCLAAVEIMGRPLPRSGRSVLGALLQRIDQPTVRLWALDAPFAARAALKRTGYKWNAGERGGPRSWYRDFTAWMDAQDEARRLCEEIYGRRVELPLQLVRDADRHSTRSWIPRL